MSDTCSECGGQVHLGTCLIAALTRAETAEERVSELEESLRDDVGGVVATNLAQRKRIQELEAERADVEGMAKEMTRARARVAELEMALRDLLTVTVPLPHGTVGKGFIATAREALRAPRATASVSTSRPAWTGCEHPGVESFERNGGTFLFWCKACGAVSDDDNENWSDPPRLLRKMHEALRSIAALEGNEQAFDWEEFAKSLQARAKAALEESTEEEDNGR
ncbi:MAG TPA: hypothetical protein VFN70_18080 [Burkholderiales bacterium]|nr:hypothetical protein [Burkholderiales bacterium]